MTVDDLLARLHKVRRNGQGWTACCPAHDDTDPSLSVKEKDDGAILLHCFAGCPPKNVVGAVGWSMTDLFPPAVRALSPGLRSERASASQNNTRPDPGPRADESLVTCLSEVRPQNVKWLWRRRIPLGMVSITFGLTGLH